MEQWLKEAKELAKEKASEFVTNLVMIAEVYHLDKEWFIQEVKSYIKLENEV